MANQGGSQAKFWIDPADQVLVESKGAWAAAATCDGRVFLWPCDHQSTTPPCCSAPLAHTGPATDFVMHWDNMRSISCGAADLQVAVYDHIWQKKLARIQDNETLNPQTRSYSCLDGSLKAGQYVVGLTDGVIKIGDLEQGALVDKVRAHRPREKDLNKADVACVRADWEQRQIVSCSWDRCVGICDVRSGKWVRSLTLKGHGDMVGEVDVCFQRHEAVSVGSEDKFIHWDLGTGKAIKELSGPGRQSNAVRVDWQTMAAATAHDDGTVKVWDLNANEMKLQIDCERDQIEALDVDWKKQWILTGSWDYKVKLFDLKSGRCLKEFKECASRPCTRVILKK